MTTLNLSWTLPTGAAFAAADYTEEPTPDGPKTAHLSGLAVPLGVPSNPSSDGHRYEFSTGPDNADDLVDVVVEHNEDQVAGRLAEAFVTDESGLLARARLFATTRGRDLAVEVAEGARAGFSIGAAIHAYTEAAGGVRKVSSWSAQHLGVVRRPAFSQSAGVVVTASAHREEEHMPTTTTEPAVKVEELPTPEGLPTVAELAALVAEHLGDKKHPEAHPLAQFGSFAQFCEAFQAADVEKAGALQAAFAVPDQVTPDNPGVMVPTWRNDVKQYIDSRRPVITAFGGPAGLPGTGLEVNWPYLDPSLDIDTIIAQQLTEKASLSGVKVNILKGTETIKTAGAVSDISYQLIMRSSPSYLATYYQVLAAAWARYGEAKFEAKLIASGTDALAEIPDPSDAAAVRAWLFAASADVEDATGAPANVVLVDKATFIAMGSNPALVDPKYGTQNVPGTASASTLSINISGLEIQRAPFFPAETALVAHSSVAKYGEDGPKIATEEDVRKLGRDVAVWGMYEDGEVYFPNALRIYSPQGV